MIGRVYKICNNDVGSTTQCLSKRFSQHKSKYTRWMDGKHANCPAMICHSFEEHGVDAFHIELLEEIEFVDKCQLLQAENRYISELECVNKKLAFTGMSKLECKKQYGNRYREANRDKIHQKLNQKFNCDCGGKYTYVHKAAHMKTKKHIDYLNSL